MRAYVEYNLARVLGEPPLTRDASALFDSFGLTSREREVATLVCRGHSNTRIATELRVGIATVKTHLLHVFSKAGVASRAALLALLVSRPVNRN